jgi:hypothetical protein
MTEALQSFNPEKRLIRAPKLRETSFKDHAQIVALESKYGLLSKGYDEWSHLWLNNPLYRKFQRDWSIGWVLEDENQQIVGSMGNIPLMYEFQGRMILAASGRHWVAEPSYRGFSLELLERVINQRHVDLYINNTVSPEATEPLKVFQCNRVPTGAWDETAFWITSRRGFLESFLTLKGYSLAKPLSYPISSLIFLKDLFSTKHLRDTDIEVKPCPEFDERFDHFWIELKKKRPDLLLAVRTREMLAWHYKYALRNGRLWILTVVDGGRLVAYGTFERKDKLEFGLKRMSLVDFQSLDGSTDLLLPLLSWAAKKCRTEGIHVLECVGRWLEKGGVLERIAPYQRKISAWSYYYRANDPKLAESLREDRAWSPTLFDGDASLCAGLMTPSLAYPRWEARRSIFPQTQISAHHEQQAMRFS